MDKQPIAAKSEGVPTGAPPTRFRNNQVRQWQEACLEMIEPGPVRPFWLLYARTVLERERIRQHLVYQRAAEEIDTELARRKAKLVFAEGMAEPALLEDLASHVRQHIPTLDRMFGGYLSLEIRRFTLSLLSTTTKEVRASVRLRKLADAEGPLQLPPRRRFWSALATRSFPCAFRWPPCGTWSVSRRRRSSW